MEKRRANFFIPANRGRDSDTMECSSELADLTLVSRHYPITQRSWSRKIYSGSYATQPVMPHDRSSLASDLSAPGLIDDRTDSEISDNDNYQQSTGTLYFWNSYWRLDDENKNEPEVRPRKQYAIYTPSPQHHHTDSVKECYRSSPSWPPLDSAVLKSRAQQISINHTPACKAVAFPIRAKPASPSWENSRPRGPARKEISLSSYLDQSTSPVTAFLNSLPNYVHRMPEPKPIVPEAEPDQHSTFTVTEEPEPPQTCLSSITPSHPARDKTSRPKTSPSCPNTTVKSRHVKRSHSFWTIFPKGSSQPKPCPANRPPLPLESELYSNYPLNHNFSAADITHDQKCQNQRQGELSIPDEKPRSSSKHEGKVDEEEPESKVLFTVRKRSMSDLGRRFARNTGLEASKKKQNRATPTPTKPTGTQSHDRKRFGSGFFGRMLEWRTK